MAGTLGMATRIRTAVAEACGAEASELRPETALYDDLGADSLSVMEMLCVLEEELGIELPESSAFVMGLRTVGDVVEAFESHAL